MKKRLAALVTLFVLVVTSLPFTAFAADADPVTGFTVNSQAVYLINNESGMVIYEKNADTPMYPASLVKIMTALIAIENCSDLEGTVTTAPYWVFDELYGMNASNADIRPGEEVRMIDLLYALMLRSACEAAGIIADCIADGDEAAFVQMMNDKAKEIGCTNTHFTNPHGLHDENQYTTAKDVYLITKYAMQYPIFVQIATSNKYTMPATNKHSEERTISHTCAMMDPNRGGTWYYEYIRAIKTGTTDESGRNLVSFAEKDAYSYTLVTMGAPIYYDNGDTIGDNLSYVDAKSLYEWAFNNWSVRTVVKTSSVKGQVKVNMVKDKDVVNVFPANEVERLMRKDIDLSSLQEIKVLEEEVDAPVTAGQKLGTLEIKLADETIAKVDLVAGESLERSNWLYFLRRLKNFFTSTPFKLIIVGIILLIGVYIAYMITYNKKRRRKRRRTGRRF
ncbi:MAG: D-alanyl-D-alanine carboxypeptidase [Oscillospiraceae bacterium]|nr:D-alanyl-D-alanine carboxypeptidase [Oscillospiraceae bacterium]